MTEAFVSPAVAALFRWIQFTGASLLVGVIAARAHTPSGAYGAGERRLVRVVRVSAIGMVVAALVRMAQQAVALAPSPSEAWSLVPILVNMAWGYAWTGQLVAGAVLAARPSLIVDARRRRGTPWLGIGLVAAVVVAPAFQGHAIGAADLTAAAILADVAHMLGAAVWIGTLAVLVLVTLPGATRDASRMVIDSFSPWALAAAALVVATGLFGSWLHVRRLARLRSTTYGQLLLLKLALVLGVVVLGAWNWRRLTPRMVDDDGVAALRRSATRELLLAAAVLAVTAVLVATPLPDE